MPEPPFLSIEEFKSFILSLLDDRPAFIRIGQNAANLLSTHHMPLYKWIYVYYKDADPFYDDNRMGEFIKFLASAVDLNK